MKSIDTTDGRARFDDEGCGHVEPFPLPERAPLVAPATAKHMRIEDVHVSVGGVEIRNPIDTIEDRERQDAPARAAFDAFETIRANTFGDGPDTWESLEEGEREAWRAASHAAISSAFGRLADGR